MKEKYSVQRKYKLGEPGCVQKIRECYGILEWWCYPLEASGSSGPLVGGSQIGRRAAR